MKLQWTLFLIVVSTATGAEIPEWVEHIRVGKMAGPKFETETATKWLDAELRPNEMTKADVFELLGDPAKQKVKIPKFGHDLDRPERDKIESLQYVLWFHDNVNWGALTVDFDRESGMLLNFGIGGSICGFCPHVLAHDGDNWRLEGKMLAGRIGADRAGRDLIVLPRLTAEDGVARVQLANWAPEIEQLREPGLFTVAVRPGEELDAGVDGEPVLWKSVREVSLDGLDPAGGDLLILELMNTAELERYLRPVFLDGAPETRNTSLTLDFGAAGSIEVPAIGTKFLRRVVVPIPSGATEVKIDGRKEFWFSRRAWIGKRVSAEGRSVWVDSQTGEIQLKPLETAEIRFPVELKGNLRFALRLSGFYTFDQSANSTPGESP